MLNVYVVHSSALSNRKPMCEDLKKRLESDMPQLSFQYITEHEPEELSQIPTDQLVNLNPLEEPAYAEFNRLIRPMTLRSVSNCMKHRAALIRIATYAGDSRDLHLILEDDVCFADTVVQQLKDLVPSMSSVIPDADILFLGFPGVPTDGSSPFVRTTEVYKVLPGCDSYFITTSAAKRLIEVYMPIKLVNNAHLSYFIETLKLNSYASVPHVFVEGSKLGTYVSSLNPNNLLIYNPIFRQIFEIVQKETGFDQDDKNKLEKLWSELQFKNHPDFLYLKGLYMLKDKQFPKAREIFERVFQLYQNNKCLLSRESLFLNNYIELCKVFN